MEVLWIVSLIIAAVGALNWGLVALFNFNLVSAVTTGDRDNTNAITRLVYVVVAIAGILTLIAIADSGWI